MANNRDVRSVATFAFAKLQLNPMFRRQHPWVRNAVTCVESDSVTEVFDVRLAEYFPDGTGVVACYFPDRHQFRVFRVPPLHPRTDSNTRTVTYDFRNPALTMGMFIDTMLRDPDWEQKGLEIAVPAGAF